MEPTIVKELFTNYGPIGALVAIVAWFFWQGVPLFVKALSERDAVLERMTDRFDKMLNEQRLHCEEHRREMDEILARRGDNR